MQIGLGVKAEDAAGRSCVDGFIGIEIEIEIVIEIEVPCLFDSDFDRNNIHAIIRCGARGPEYGTTGSAGICWAGSGAGDP